VILLRVSYINSVVAAMDSSIDYFVDGTVAVRGPWFSPCYSWGCTCSAAAWEGVADKGVVLALIGEKEKHALNAAIERFV
jgi:hypothetical protein